MVEMAGHRFRFTRWHWICVGCFAAICTGLAQAAPKARFFNPSPGYQGAKDLTSDFHGRVDSIAIVVKDAFDGAEVHSDIEARTFEILNTLHIESKDWVVYRRLPFALGDTVSAEILREAEKNLRDEEFFADAYVEVSPMGDTGWAVKVTTFDQWTLAASPNFKYVGNELVWWFGVVESNLLGFGQRLGFFVSHDLERDTRWLDYANTFFTPWQLSLAASYAWTSDGYTYNTSLSRPLRSREDKWGFTLSSDGSLLSQNLYLSGNDLDKLDGSAEAPADLKKRYESSNIIGYWDDVGTHAAYASVTRSFGNKLKISVSPYYSRFEQYLSGSFHARNFALRQSLGIDGTPSLYRRHNELLGLSGSLYQYDYKTVRNFRNLKWSENIETGWRLTASAAKNQEWMGADQDDWFFSQTGVLNNAWLDRLFLNSSASASYYLRNGEKWVDGTVSGNVETQFKEVWWTSSLFSAGYAHLFATADSRNYTLGEENGLNGYPNFFYTGKARLLFAAEQRFFPAFEILTIVPALAVYFNAGNTYDSYRRVDLGDMHYAVGVGLRAGFSRSVQKVVNHVNLSFPLGEDNISGFVFSVKASKGL